MLHALLQNHSQGNLALASTTANNAVQSEYQPWNGDELETSRAGGLVYVPSLGLVKKTELRIYFRLQFVLLCAGLCYVCAGSCTDAQSTCSHEEPATVIPPKPTQLNAHHSSVRICSPKINQS